MEQQDPFRLDGKVAAVVGAASGIGAAVALACARQGARVACLDQNADGAAAVAARLTAGGTAAEAGPLDIRDAAAVAAAFDALRERHGSHVTGSVLFVDAGWTAVDGRFQPPGM